MILLLSLCSESATWRNMATGWNRFFSVLEDFLGEIQVRSEHGNTVYCEYVVERCGLAIRSLSTVLDNADELRVDRLAMPSQVDPDIELESLEEVCTCLSSLISSLREISSEWEMELAAAEASASVSEYLPTSHVHGEFGRPRYQVDQEQVLYLMEMSFSWNQIALMLGISRHTLWRRRQEWGMVGQQSPSQQDIGAIIQRIRSSHPDMGECMIIGQFRAMGYRISRAKIRRAIQEVDPLYTSLRWRNRVIPRRPYSVRSPNSLWHVGEYDI